MTLADELYDRMEAALLKAPKPKGMTDAEYARSVLDAIALNQLKRAQRQQEFRRMEQEAKQAAIEEGSRFFVCTPTMASVAT